MTDTGELVDLALSSLGTWNKKRICISGLLSLVLWTSVLYHIMSSAFTNEFVPHHCAVNKTDRLPMEWREGKLQTAQCKKYINTTSNVTVPCGSEGWEYDWPPGDYTIVNEFDLVCDNSFGADLSLFCFYSGNVVSAFFANRLADKFGRKWIYIYSEILLCILGLILAFSPNIQFFSAFKFLIGMMVELCSASGFVLVCEMFPTSERSFAGTFTMLNWCVAYAILSGLAYQWRNWRHLQIAISLPFILVVSFIWILPESIPWLLANSREVEAVKLLKKMAGKAADMTHINCLLKDMNERENMTESLAKFEISARLPLDEIEKDDCNLEPVPKPVRTEGKYVYGWSEIFIRKILCIHQLLMGFAWFSNTLVYLCLSLLSVTLAGNNYLNVLLSGMVEIPAYIANAFVLTKYGRKIPLIVSMVACGVLMTFVPFIPNEANGTNLNILIITLFLTAKMFISFSYGAMSMYVLELYPTNLRNTGFGIASFYGKVGSLLVPLILFLSKIELWLPGLLCGLISLVSGIILYLLPETHNKPLAVTIEDVEVMSRFHQRKKSSKD